MLVKMSSAVMYCECSEGEGVRINVNPSTGVGALDGVSEAKEM